MKTLDRNVLRAARVFVFSLAVSSTGSTGVLAQATSAENALTPGASGSERFASVVAFNWHVKKYRRSAAEPLPAQSLRVSSGLQLGNGSFVCTPAGAGHRSRCFER